MTSSLSLKKRLSIGILIVFLLSLFFVPYIPSLRSGSIKKTSYMKQEEHPFSYSWIPLSNISKNLQQAVVIAEDSRFYQHRGVDYEEMKHAFFRNVNRRSFSHGFSTITMQVARNLYLSRDKYVWRKLAEIWIAWKMEYFLSKDRILEIYLNIAEWGKGIYGAEAAAHYYFKKTASDLTVSEAAFLASILPSPKKWGRFPPPRHVTKRMRFIERRLIAPLPTQELLESETVQEPSPQDLENIY
ncbi:MAG: monofunctional biosynthetic peptidoglycan transglycosylase [Deltaproteobacteria bacterium RIFCSPLOWO2_02_FULL_44_10]|nr:MAG: monofunctional biosynthetic peptidoglycan transglycosylase [Deltaproteobacteria bacterium RIFCSPHIGHO2_02_FULL_44_16]OGQ46377.1 MAG: monofunctional biosynthetic peptidoglycan transglycosylase [Deltaproteobacteria bacterium RIFCSPLOWO2_02_FULL_44_10]